MKLIGAAIGLALATALAGCAGGYGYFGFGTAPDDALGMVQADSACDFGRGATDMGSPCYVTRRTFDYVAKKYD